MSKRLLATMMLIVLALLVGCETQPSHTYEDLLGEWDFPNNTHISVMQDSDTPSQKMLDIRWQEGTVEYFAMIDGTSEGATFTGTYAYSTTADNGSGSLILYYGDDVDEPHKDITITLTLEDDTLKAVCTGDAPLGGKTFTLGTLT